MIHASVVIVIQFLIGSAIPLLPFLAGAALIEIVIQSRYRQPQHRNHETSPVWTKK
jgi:hypothetical protein